MPTGDGLLVRLLPIGTVPLAAFVSLCAAAREHGNGIIEITARGSIQVRGLSAASALYFADAVAALGIAAADGIPVITEALAGLDPEEIFDGGTLAADLRSALVQKSLALRLAPKISVAVDGGGAFSLDTLAADVRLRAVKLNHDIGFHLSTGGDGANAAPLGLVSRTHGVEAALGLLDAIVCRGRDVRARDILAAKGIDAFRSAVAGLLISDATPPATHTPREAIGSHNLRGGSLACGMGLPFGHSDATTLGRLAEAATEAGAIGIRAAPGRILMVIGLARTRAAAFTTAAERLGFIVDANDARRRVVACAGAPICISANIPARAMARVIAERVKPLRDEALTIHISGCAKGCAHPGPARLTVVGTPGGCALVANGSARDTPFAVVATSELAAAIARHAREITHGDSHV
jgi:precorrin-3B synthase